MLQWHDKQHKWTYIHQVIEASAQQTFEWNFCLTWWAELTRLRGYASTENLDMSLVLLNGANQKISMRSCTVCLSLRPWACVHKYKLWLTNKSAPTYYLEYLEWYTNNKIHGRPLHPLLKLFGCSLASLLTSEVAMTSPILWANEPYMRAMYHKPNTDSSLDESTRTHKRRKTAIDSPVVYSWKVAETLYYLGVALGEPHPILLRMAEIASLFARLTFMLLLMLLGTFIRWCDFSIACMLTT